jgi:hydroxymethylpyrimidine pyrophosphatase-like HAD family hydrolase
MYNEEIMGYKAIIFDLDGTAIPNKANAQPSTDLIQAIYEGQKTLILSAATGRPFPAAKDILQTLELASPCIVAAGTQIVNPQTSEVLWEAQIEDSDIQEILLICHPYHYQIKIRDEPLGKGKPAADRDIHGSVNVLYVIGCAPADAKDILERLASIPTVSASGVISWTGNGIDIHVTHRDATKEHAVAELLRILGIVRNDVIGVGDGDNDIHLFNAVGLKVAMGNATDLLKSLADAVCDSVEDEGLAKIIRQYS